MWTTDPVPPEIDPRGETIDMLDLAPYRTERRIKDLAHDPTAVTLRWDNGRESRFDAVWLRDNCACPVCRHPHALERRFLLVDAPDSIELEHAALTDGGNLTVSFAPESAGGEPHVSRFDAAWLWHHDYSHVARAERVTRPRLWDASLAEHVPVFDYTDVTSEEGELRNWLAALRDWGLTVVRGAPAVAGELRHIAERIGPLRLTNFGTIFDVISEPHPNATANTSAGLEPHTDLTNWRSPPDFFLLFCVEHTAEGGDSTVIDGFRVAEELRANDPEAFEILATRPIDFRFHDETCDFRYRAPTIELNRDGDLSAVRFNNWLRGALDLPPADVLPTYRALRSFWRLLRDPRFRIQLRLQPGDLLAIDNCRVMHGRTPFNQSSGRRHYQGCHLDRDFVMNRLRLLERREAEEASRSARK